jgi:hypothetical protein
MNEDVFNFEDFLAGRNQTKKSEKVSESISDEEPVKEPYPPIPSEEEDIKVEVVEDEVKEEDEEETSHEEKSFYPLYKDKSENFSCDIYVEGAKTDETIARLIVETEDWTLMFPGEIKNGKVNIPVRKLNLFDEGQVGKIKLEVIAEGTIFIPWEDEFKIKVSKKVSVSLNENKKVENPKKGVGVKVNVKR